MTIRRRLPFAAHDARHRFRCGTTPEKLFCPFVQLVTAVFSMSRPWFKGSVLSKGVFAEQPK